MPWLPQLVPPVIINTEGALQAADTSQKHGSGTPQLRLHSACEAWEHAHYVQRLQTRTPLSYFIRMPACTLHPLTAKTYPEGFDLPPLKLTPDTFCHKHL